MNPNSFDDSSIYIGGIIPQASSYPYDIDINETLETVKGELLVIQQKVDMTVIQQMNDDNFVRLMKKKMIEELAEQILKNKLAEFTKEENMQTGDILFRARVYLVPDDKVRIIRKNQK